MAKTKRASPKPGRDGSNGPAPDDILNALALEIIDQDHMKIIRERRKAHRKTAEGKMVDLKQLDRMYSLRDEPVSEIEKFFRSAFTHMSAFWEDLTQLDLFVPKATRTAKAAHAHHGMMAALKGEDEAVPPNLTPEESNEWLGGYNKGWLARESSGAQTLADTLAGVMATTEGTVIDGKTGKPVKDGAAGRSAKAVAVAEQAKKDFEADNGDAKLPGEIVDAKPFPGADSDKLPPGDSTMKEAGATARTPDFSEFSNMPAQWSEEQSETFRQWAKDLGPDGVADLDLTTLPPGIVKGLEDLAFAASPEELAKQTTRAAIEDAKPGHESATDPLTVNGETYPSKKAADAARKKLSQSEKADLKRKAAGLA